MVFVHNKLNDETHTNIDDEIVEDYVIKLPTFTYEKLFIFQLDCGHFIARTKEQLKNPYYSDMNLFTHTKSSVMYYLDKYWFDCTGCLPLKRNYVNLDELDSLISLNVELFYDESFFN